MAVTLASALFHYVSVTIYMSMQRLQGGGGCSSVRFLVADAALRYIAWIGYLILAMFPGCMMKINGAHLPGMTSPASSPTQFPA